MFKPTDFQCSQKWFYIHHFQTTSFIGLAHTRPSYFIISTIPKKLIQKLIQLLQKKLSSGSGRFISMKGFITVILPKGVRFLLDQAFSTFFISFSLFSKLIVTISSTSVENTTPSTLNVTGFQSRLICGIYLIFEFLRDPIHTALVYQH